VRSVDPAASAVPKGPTITINSLIALLALDSILAKQDTWLDEIRISCAAREADVQTKQRELTDFLTRRVIGAAPSPTLASPIRHVL